MELVDQHTKKIMEGCKERARAVGLSFEDESLEYIVTNRDLLELSPKMMIPTLYDYWVHDVDVLKQKGKYELYPSNPYETVINTRPAISYYNDNNPDWLNVMIFYHVLAHIDFFHNNLYFRHTWDYDFTGRALSEKRTIAKLRAKKGRWVDYVIEFARGIDNLVGYFGELSQLNRRHNPEISPRIDYYFDVFLQAHKKVHISKYIKEIERYNQCIREKGDLGEELFFKKIHQKYPEFVAFYEKYRQKHDKRQPDLMEYFIRHSPLLKQEENAWMKTVLKIVRNTSLFFQPQIRTKIMNEGWASYWHETLFLKDDRIKGHEVDFARINAGVTAMPRVGLNPYALGMRLFYYIKELADKGKLDFSYQRIMDAQIRKNFNRDTNNGMRTIFDVRENFCDYRFLTEFVDQDFVDRHRLFVSGRRLNRAKKVWQYYVKSRDAGKYLNMLTHGLYHPPAIDIEEDKKNGKLNLNHLFEGKPLVREFIANTLLGAEFFWGGAVTLETSEVKEVKQAAVAGSAFGSKSADDLSAGDLAWERVRYTMSGRKLTRHVMLTN